MSKEWKIYTKTGDKGKTALIGGTRVPKYDIRIEAYGTVDELNAFIGLVRDMDIDTHSKDLLLEIQDRLFTMESCLAQDGKSLPNALPTLNPEDVELLEKEMDKMNEQLPELTAFILPGGHPAVSYCHIARTVCRRAERLTIRMNEQFPTDGLNIRYLNRLSDYLFVLARKLSRDLKVTESIWKPRV
ncbi:MAG TPA: cob(I)yrinic acid a,c-diamide adenosyltransferase [Candidatus Marinimicrobia bacterium]|nr:cob(I)yrinic acid a,c-diamide adenosyltransferase [Candidatus Neomarinimicrobiota bacterium]